MQPDDIPVPAPSVQTEDDQNILIDSGFPAFRASTRKLAEIAKRENVTLTIYGHDAG